MQEEKRESNSIILNSEVRDSGGKLIFGDNLLCSQFLRDYVDLPGLKGVTSEDIEDVSDQFVPLFAEERNADCVKRVQLKNGEVEEPMSFSLRNKKRILIIFKMNRSSFFNNFVSI